MPKVAENTDEDKVTQKSIGLQSKIKHGCKIQLQKKICTDGIDSRNGSEINNMIKSINKKGRLIYQWEWCFSQVFPFW